MFYIDVFLDLNLSPEDSLSYKRQHKDTIISEKIQQKALSETTLTFDFLSMNDY